MPSSFTHEMDFRQERDFSQKINATFAFLRAHWRPLGRVLLYIVLPALLLQGILQVFVQSQLQAFQSSTEGYGATAVERMGNMFRHSMVNPLSVANILLSYLVTALLILTVYGYVAVQIQHDGPEEVSVRSVWHVVRGRLLGAVLSIVGLTLITVVASAFLLIPGIYVGVAFSLFFIIQLMEGTSFVTTVRRCLQLIRGKWWSTFGLLFIIGLIAWLLTIAFSMPIGIIAATMQTNRITPEVIKLYTLVLTAILSIGNIILMPVFLLALAFQYFNLVERKEGVGMRHLVDSIGGQPAATVSATAYRPDEEGEY